jgi:CheY-like chemotaxis protein
MIQRPDQYRVLVVDDEPDVFAITRMSLRGMRYADRDVELVFASSGRETVEFMQRHPDTAVMLLDVVMETMMAGLDTCRVIREEQGNRFVRILLRTGQPGVMPERQAVDAYDIDGYLPKAEITATRLYTAVRTALKAFDELLQLERYREVLTFVHNSVAALHTFEPLELSLQRILETAVAIAPTPLALLQLETFEEQGNPRRVSLHIAADSGPGTREAAMAHVLAHLAADPASPLVREGGQLGTGYLVPLSLHRELGRGWIYLDQVTPDTVGLQALPLLAAHASNALYSTVAQALLAAREGPLFSSITV